MENTNLVTFDEFLEKALSRERYDLKIMRETYTWQHMNKRMKLLENEAINTDDIYDLSVEYRDMFFLECRKPGLKIMTDALWAFARSYNIAIYDKVYVYYYPKNSKYTQEELVERGKKEKEERLIKEREKTIQTIKRNQEIREYNEQHKTAPTLAGGWCVYIFAMIFVSIFHARVFAWVMFTIWFIIWRAYQIDKFN